MIASRDLKIRVGREERELHVRIFRPEAVGGIWTCAYEIDWPEGVKRSQATGLDSIQTLTSVFQMIGEELYTSSYNKAGAFIFSEGLTGYGFPVPPHLRPALIGHDAEFL